MKVYINARKQGDRCQYGLAIYENNGKLIDSFTKYAPTPENKFDIPLDAMIWGVRKVRMLSQNNKIDKHEPINLFIASKTLNTWFDKGVAPEPYTIKFSELLLEANFLINPTELVLNTNIEKKVRYQNSVEDTPIKLTELYA